MDLSRLRTRRGVVAALVAAAASRVLPAPVRAQLNSGCEYGITNGLVTIGGTDCHVAVPGHMIDARSTTDNASANTGTQGILTVEADVTIFASGGDDYLLVNRGSQIYAEGTASQPIVMPKGNTDFTFSNVLSRPVFFPINSSGIAPLLIR